MYLLDTFSFVVDDELLFTQGVRFSRLRWNDVDVFFLLYIKS